MFLPFCEGHQVTQIDNQITHVIDLLAQPLQRSVFGYSYRQSTHQVALKEQNEDEAWQHCRRAEGGRVAERP